MQRGYRGSAEPPLANGDVAATAYMIGHEVARTDTGVVFEAHDMLLDRLVAFKLAWRDPGTPSLIVEARRCAAVRDSCAVQIYGMGRQGDVEYAVGERVEGKLLRDTFDRTMPTDVYLTRLRRLIAAVAQSHEAGIPIGELSGATVLVEKDDRLVLGRLSLSQVPAFGPHGQLLAPEVLRGEVDPLDPAAAEAIDLYGIGCIAVEMVAGAPPFSDDNRERELHGHTSERPPRISDLRPDLPSELSDLVDWLLAKQPRARPRTARDVLTQVEAVIERAGASTHTLRVLIVEDDTARARWLWGIARRAHAATIVEIASEGTDAAHKLNRDQPDLVFINAKLRGVMNALELCMYARGLESPHHALGEVYLIGDVATGDASVFDGADVHVLVDDDTLPTVLIERIRSALTSRRRTRQSRTTISG